MFLAKHSDLHSVIVPDLLLYLNVCVNKLRLFSNGVLQNSDAACRDSTQTDGEAEVADESGGKAWIRSSGRRV